MLNVIAEAGDLYPGIQGIDAEQKHLGMTVLFGYEGTMLAGKPDGKAPSS